MVKHHEHTEHIYRPKRKWWQWVALALMLLAIGTYVLTLDDSVVPARKDHLRECPPKRHRVRGNERKDSIQFAVCRFLQRPFCGYKRKIFCMLHLIEIIK